MHHRQSALLLVILVPLCPLIAVSADPRLPRSDKASANVEYGRDVRPILAAKCFACHGQDPKAIQAGLRLDRREDAVRRLASGHVAIMSGKPSVSELVRRIDATQPSLRMPPPTSNKTLTAEEKDILRRWILQGAEYRPHWAFVKPLRPALPRVTSKSWPRNEIDAFVLARLEKEGLRPRPEADRRTQIRRVTLDLTGLPPTPDAVDAFLADRSQNAYEKAVDRLLASPRYGEKMAETWMDDARYADSNGYQADYERFQWMWRDWVINAFNRNLPFDRFTIEQLAGDMLPNATADQKIATGFSRNHRINTEGGIIPEEWRVETVVDRVETTSAVWLGLTMGCGRCHDHKYDPISQREFYQFFAYFNNVPESGIGVERPVNHPPILQMPTPEQVQKRTALDRAIADAQKVLDAQTDAKEKEKSKAAVAAARKARTEYEDQVNSVMVMDELPKPRDCFVLQRGQYDKHGDAVTASLPGAFGSLPPGAPNNRLGLAMWIASPENPLTARVAVNRFWERFFGIGLVSTTEDFGTRAEYPSHPELLDWLATEFVRLKWDMKALQKEIVMSATYRQSSQAPPSLYKRDPQNRLLARGPRFRLSGESIRDQALFVSGLLVEKIGGPSVRPYMPEGLWDEVNVYGNLRNYKHDKGDNLYRRSLYTFWKRTSGPPTLGLFDVPGREMCRVRRSRTNTPLQALALMNEVTFVEAARAFAQRMINEGGRTSDQRVDWAVRRMLARPPTAAEQRVFVTGLERRISKYRADADAVAKLNAIGDAARDPKIDPAELAAYTMTASVLLNMDEAVTRE